MRRSCGGLIVAVAALLVCCNANPHQDQDVSGNEQGSGKRYEVNGHKNRVSRPIFDGILPDGSPRSSYGISLLKMLDYISRSKDTSKYPLMPMEIGLGSDYDKRNNFDEIDRSDLDTFISKRNFDEIDRSSLPFPYATKRFYHLYGPNNYLDLDMPVSSFDKKRYRPDYPMDEIDLSHFPIGSKRSSLYPSPRNLQ